MGLLKYLILFHGTPKRLKWVYYMKRSVWGSATDGFPFSNVKFSGNPFDRKHLQRFEEIESLSKVCSPKSR